MRNTKEASHEARGIYQPGAWIRELAIAKYNKPWSSAQFTREDFAGLVFNLEQKKPIGRADLRLYSRGEVHEDGGNFFVWLNRVDPRNTPLPENLWGIFEAQLADGTRIDLGAFRTNVNNIRANLTTIGAQTFPDMPVGTREGVFEIPLEHCIYSDNNLEIVRSHPSAGQPITMLHALRVIDLSAWRVARVNMYVPVTGKPKPIAMRPVSITA